MYISTFHISVLTTEGEPPRLFLGEKQMRSPDHLWQALREAAAAPIAPQVLPPSVTTVAEAVAEFLSKGGAVRELPPAGKAQPPRPHRGPQVQKQITLEDLGLGDIL